MNNNNKVNDVNQNMIINLWFLPFYWVFSLERFRCALIFIFVLFQKQYSSTAWGIHVYIHLCMYKVRFICSLFENFICVQQHKLPKRFLFLIITTGCYEKENVSCTKYGKIQRWGDNFETEDMLQILSSIRYINIEC